MAPMITDNGMRYYQLRARQLLLMKQDDHNWNEFCKKNTCGCESCQPQLAKTTREAAVQAAVTKTPANNVRKSPRVPGFKSQADLQSLNEIKGMLDEISQNLTQMNFRNQDRGPQVDPVKKLFDTETSRLMLAPNNERRMQLLQNCFQSSLQRLQPSTQFAANGKKKSFFLPHELQKQRSQARRIYLASLAKNISKPIPMNSKLTKRSVPNYKSPGKQINTNTKPHIKLREKSVETMPNEIETAVADRNVVNSMDENIEKAIDLIVDELIREPCLDIHKIKEEKCRRRYIKHSHQQFPPDRLTLEKSANIQTSTLPPSSKWMKVQQNLPNIRPLSSQPNKNFSKQSEISPNYQELPVESKILEENCFQDTKSLGVVPPKMSNSTEVGRILQVNAKVANEVSKSKKLYRKYLERRPYTEKGPSGTWVFSTMVAESLLDDCIAEVSQELFDITASYVSDLYEQEFQPAV